MLTVIECQLLGSSLAKQYRATFKAASTTVSTYYMGKRPGMLRIITANVNGIRAAAKKGFFSWLSNQDADVVCIQETKAQIHQ